MISLLYILSAAVGLGFLIFIHELGHYVVARRVGMRVEVFSIGFGKAIYSWNWDGVRWQICWLPFGGYVKMAGMESEGDLEPSEIADGFWGRSPLDRIKVALAGPVVNLVFAFLIFSVIFFIGGRQKDFSDFTRHVGWVDTKSDLYKKGLRPGDVIYSYDGHEFTDSRDHLYAAMLGNKTIEVKGAHLDSRTGTLDPFTYNIKPYQHPDAIEPGVLTTGVLGSASYLIYDRHAKGGENPLSEGSPMLHSGLTYGDRILWVDGVSVHSLHQLGEVLNDSRSLLTIARNGSTFLARVPHVSVKELRLDEEHREELTDWQFAAGMTGTPLQDLSYLPYNLSADGTVEGRLGFIDQEREQEYFPAVARLDLNESLEPGDRIIAVHGVPVSHSYQAFARLQERKVHVVVERNEVGFGSLDWDLADADYDRSLDHDSLASIVDSIGSKAVVNAAGSLTLLKPVTPITYAELMAYGKDKAAIENQQREVQAAVDRIEDPLRRQKTMEFIKERDKRFLLGVSGVQDRKVCFNPGPAEQFILVFKETLRTLKALITGYLSPKFVSGPVGIVQVIHHGWSIGVVEVLFWLGVISLNLGVLNLMPVPVLDGGYVVLSLFEIVSRKRLKVKQVERLIIPFAIVMIALFLYLTFNDLSRLFGGTFG